MIIKQQQCTKESRKVKRKGGKNIFSGPITLSSKMMNVGSRVVRQRNVVAVNGLRQRDW